MFKMKLMLIGLLKKTSYNGKAVCVCVCVCVCVYAHTHTHTGICENVHRQDVFSLRTKFIGSNLF